MSSRRPLPPWEVPPGMDVAPLEWDSMFRSTCLDPSLLYILQQLPNLVDSLSSDGVTIWNHHACDWAQLTYILLRLLSEVRGDSTRVDTANYVAKWMESLQAENRLIRGEPLLTEDDFHNLAEALDLTLGDKAPEAE